MTAIVANPLQIITDGYGHTVGITNDQRLKVDIIAQAASHTHPDVEDAIQIILKDLDGYHPDITGQEHYNQLSSALQTILKDLDGYALQSALSGLNQTVDEHYNQHGEALYQILNQLDGYDGSINDLSNTIQEHYNQHSDALQTILKDLDGYIPVSEKGVANGIPTLDAGGKIPAGQIPAVALPEVHVVLDDTERLALTVQEGDEAIQTSDGYHWIYDGYDWYVRPVNPHNADHYVGGSDEIVVQNLGSGDAEEGQILVADGEGGWTVEDNSAGSGLGGMTHQLAFVKNGSAKNTWLSLYENGISSNVSPAIMPWKSKLIGISFTNKKDNADPTIKIYIADEGDGNSPLTKMFEWDLTSARVARKTNFTSDIIFDAGDKIGVFIADEGGDAQDPVVVLYFRVEDDAINEESTENYSDNFSLGGTTSRT
jgi:hypothetical protein